MARIGRGRPRRGGRLSLSNSAADSLLCIHGSSRMLVGADIIHICARVLALFNFHDSDYNLINKVSRIINWITLGSSAEGRQLGDAHPLTIFAWILDVDVIEEFSILVGPLDDPQGDLNVLAVAAVRRPQLGTLDQAGVLVGGQDLEVLGWLMGIGIKRLSTEQGSDITGTVL